MIGFETIGNAILTVIDNDLPILSTDPWLFGKPYFNSWDHKYKIPKRQLENIKKSKYIWISHGHPDHLDPETIKIFKENNCIILLPDHYGDRIFNDLRNDYKIIKIISNEWMELSKNIRIKSFADWNQDATLIVEILKKDYVLNVNDGHARGWSSTVKKTIKNGRNRFLLKGLGWAPADMINIFDEDNNFIEPIAAHKHDLGPVYKASLNNWNCNFAIPFSAFHKLSRTDSSHMIKYETPIEAHKKGFKSKNSEILPPFISWDCTVNNYSEIKPEKNNSRLISPDEIGDSWTDELTNDDMLLVEKYIKSIEHLKYYFGSVTFKVGNNDFSIKLSNLKPQIRFEVPRNSLITAIKYQIFDDLLIGNFMKTQLINVKSLYPDFTPFVGKYADNGGAKSASELELYFKYYKINSVDYWRDMLFAKSEDIFRRNITSKNPIWNTAKFIKNYFI